MKLATAAAVAVLTLSGSAALAQGAQGITPYYKVVEHGRSTKVDSYFISDPECRSLGRATINLLAAPQGGQVSTENGFGYPTFPSTNPRFKCDSRRMPSTLLYYQAASDFTGTDTFTVEAVYPDGTAHQTRYTVYVR
jgi:hypothetical protein